MQMKQMQSYKKFANSQLQTAINCLIYGIHCFYFDRIDNKLYQCLLTIHEEYINIIHIIIQSKSSFLFQLQHVQSISNKDIFVRQTLKNLNLCTFCLTQSISLLYIRALLRALCWLCNQKIRSMCYGRDYSTSSTKPRTSTQGFHKWILSKPKPLCCSWMQMPMVVSYWIFNSCCKFSTSSISTGQRMRYNRQFFR